MSRGRDVVILALAAWIVGGAARPADAAWKAPSFGLGFVLGEPTGLTAKVFFHRNHALDVILAYDITDEAFATAIDYHFVFDPWPFRLSFADLPIYVGIGGKLAVFGDDRPKRSIDDDKVAFGLRIPVGISMFFRRVPIEIFLEIAPGIRLFPATRADVDGGIGVRFYF